jgi:type IV pilus assembly protein PilV
MIRKTQQGFSLVESLIAVLLLGIGLLGAIGMQARSYSALSDAGMRAEATIACDQLLGEMSTDQANLSAYALASGGTAGPSLAPWYDATRTRIPGAIITVHVVPDSGNHRSEIDITISWTRKQGDKANTHSVTSYIAGAT